MSRLHLILIACAFCVVRAQSADRPQHNFLFVVDSSVSMEPRKASAIKWVREVIHSRFDGQIEAGDSIDIWTYDTENNLHGFPPQIWNPSNAQRIADEATQYLQNYKFKGKSEFANVVTDLNVLIPQTKSLLVIILTDGEQPFSGFSLDLEINGYLAKKGKLGTKSTDPLLISLAAINGRIRTWTAYFGDGKIGLASLPGRKSAPATVAETKPVEKKPAPAQPLPLRVSPKINTTLEPISVFNFPPGTKITPIEEPGDSPLEKPLELAIAEKKEAAKSQEKKPVEVNASPNAKSPTAAIKSATNITASATTNANIAKPVAKQVLTTNALEQKPLQIAQSIPTNAINTNAVVATVATTKPPTSAGENKASGNPSASASSGLGPEWTLQRTFYIAGMTGASCFLVGLYLLYRKFRRPSESIISRSLLQR